MGGPTVLTCSSEHPNFLAPLPHFSEAKGLAWSEQRGGRQGRRAFLACCLPGDTPTVLMKRAASHKGPWWPGTRGFPQSALERTLACRAGLLHHNSCPCIQTLVLRDSRPSFQLILSAISSGENPRAAESPATFWSCFPSTYLEQ